MPTYQQNTAADLLPDGIYPFYVKNAKLTTSQSGNEKIELILQVNGTFTVYDNLTFIENSFWKIDQFRIATGEKLGAAGSNANFEAEDCIQRRGEVEIGTNEFPKNSGRMRNQVVSYIDPSQSAAANKAREKAGALPKPKLPDPDNIPF
jgi:hypothetical protein